MVTDWSDEQHWNAQMSIYLTEFEMVTDCSDKQLENAFIPIDVFLGLGNASIYLYFLSLSL